MSLIDGKQLEQAQEPTEQEMLDEARAWGYETVEDFFHAIDEAEREAEEAEVQHQMDQMRKAVDDHNVLPNCPT